MVVTLPRSAVFPFFPDHQGNKRPRPPRGSGVFAIALIGRTSTS